MDWTSLKDYVGAPDSDDGFVTTCWDEAVVMVDNFIGTRQVPVQVIDRAYLEVGSELFHRRNAPSGITQFGSIEGTVRLARDPMTGAYPLLARWVPGF